MLHVNANSVQEKGRNKISLPHRVSQWYYKLGLFLSSYPAFASFLAIFVVLLSCYPLVNIPLPGTIPTKVIIPVHQTSGSATGNGLEKINVFGSQSSEYNSTVDSPLRWTRNTPFIYVQQIVFRSCVAPWDDTLLLTDAFRGPIAEVFKILDIVRNFEDEATKSTLGSICLHVENVKRLNKIGIFPEYNCLILSPANFWDQNRATFYNDNNILSTIFHHHNFQKGKVSTAEMLFGMHIQDTGIKRYPIRVRPRIIQFALTLVLRKMNDNFLKALKNRLIQLYPLHQFSTDVDSKDNLTFQLHHQSLMHIYYPEEFNLLEFVPLFIAFILLFLYVYYSIRKIEAIKSRCLLAACAVVTVFSSLMMSLGLCFFFGLTITMQSKYSVLPYLAILIGLENVLVITKSVLSTANTFDVKIRIAQGLSKEGWSISKTLMTEVTILTIGFATFVPVIQEFSVFAIVGLISDFFLQMLIFSTALSLDIKRVDSNHLSRTIFESNMDRRVKRTMVNSSMICQSGKINRSRSYHELTALETSETSITRNLLLSSSDITIKKIPKRLRVVNLWARTRFFQRAFMIWMICWIISIIYNAQIFVQILDLNSNITNISLNNASTKPNSTYDTSTFFIEKSDSRNETARIFDAQNLQDSNITHHLQKLLHRGYETNVRLSKFHWSAILKQYNISTNGKYVTILPSIKLSYIVPRDVAIQIRNSEEKSLRDFQWKALAAALDPLDFRDTDVENSHIVLGSMPLYPQSPMEILLSAILCAISVFVIAYTMVVCYRCICSRNYHEWRSSWDKTIVSQRKQRIFENIPIQLKGHSYKIECLVSDGTIAVTACLDGQVNVWEVSTGNLLTNISRRKYFKCYVHHTSVTKSSLTLNYTPLWSLDYIDNLIVIGCADGRLEFWDSTTGKLKCIHKSQHNNNKTAIAGSLGVTNVHFINDKIVAARLSGVVEFFRLETFTQQGKQPNWNYTSVHRRTHLRTASAGSLAICTSNPISVTSLNMDSEMYCVLEFQHSGHQQPITCMSISSKTVLTGSQDHTVKVYRTDVSKFLFTLHGHYGPITCTFIDQFQSATAGSGSQDGSLCVWNLMTGSCIYSIQAHDGGIVSIVCSPSYVISSGTDERLCIWERFQGHLLNAINVTHEYPSLLMLTSSLLVTGKQGSLIVWDVQCGEPTIEIKLDFANLQLCPKFMLFVCGSVICDYGNELRIVRFPLVANKCD